MGPAALWLVMHGGPVGPWVPVDLARSIEVGREASALYVPAPLPAPAVVVHRGASGRVRGFTLGPATQPSSSGNDAEN
jgi:hypothetical protein